MNPLAEAWRSERNWPIVVLLLVVAFALRAQHFGNPVIQVDEQFYFLVGGRILDGALPYVDIWDRKPAGLFLLYAAFRLIGGDSLLSYQIAAALSVAATGFTIYRMAIRLAGRRGAILASILYVVSLAMFDGYGGQSPVFYNLFVALAAFFLLKAGDTARPAMLLRYGAVAMLFAGIAISIKTSAIIECFVFGLILIAIGWHKCGMSARLVAAAALWASIALLPTALIYAFYALIGAFDTIWQATILSVFDRTDPSGTEWKYFKRLILPLLPIMIAAIASLWLARRGFRRDWLIVCLWLATAFIAVMGFGSFYLHYALPIMVPAAVAVAPLFDARKGWLVAVLLIGAAFLRGNTMIAKHYEVRGDGSAITRFAHIIGTHPPGCLYVFGNDSILYELTDSCLLTRYAFPSHLKAKKEAGAIGVAQSDELERILRQKPTYIMHDIEEDPKDSRTSLAILNQALKGDYGLVGVAGSEKSPKALWKRRDAIASGQRLTGLEQTVLRRTDGKPSEEGTSTD